MFVDGEFVLGGSDNAASATYLQSNTSGIVNDTHSFRIRNDGDNVKLAATGEGIVWALVSDRQSVPNKAIWHFWRFDPTT